MTHLPSTQLTVMSRVPITGMRLVAVGTDAPIGEQADAHATHLVNPSTQDQQGPLSESDQSHGASHAELLERVTQVLCDIDQRREANLREMQEACLELSIAIAARLVWAEIETDRLAVPQLVDAVLERVRGQASVSVLLNPQDVEVWKQATAGGDVDLPTSVQIVGDPQIPRGDCRAVCDEFTLVRDIELELREIHEQLLQGIEDAEVERRETRQDSRQLKRFPDRRAHS